MTLVSTGHSRTEAERIAFVRGLEHRALVFAEHQGGQADRARAVVLAAKAEFHELAARTHADDWTVLYWRLLLAQPAMRAQRRRDRDDLFALLEAGPRAVLLLRFVAGIEHVQGAQVLAVSEPAYRHALVRATEVLREHGSDESWLRVLRDRLRSDARPTHADPPEPDRSAGTAAAIPAWLQPTLWVALAVLLVIGVGSFFWHPSFFGPGRIGGIEQLREHAPAQVLPATSQLVGGGDFAQLADPQGAAIARDLDLLSWYAASAGTNQPPGNPAAPLPETTQPENGAPEVDTEGSEDSHAP